MKKIQKTYWTLILIAAHLLLTQNAFAIAKEGHVDSLERNLREILENRLENEGYMGDLFCGQNFDRALSAYLWDNRHWMTRVDIDNARQVDLMVCLMSKKKYKEFDKYATDIKAWCNQIIKVSPSYP